MDRIERDVWRQAWWLLRNRRFRLAVSHARFMLGMRIGGFKSASRV